ncbi:leucine-rich repeat-containing protein 46-like [Littorina saxatilis]|uniref:Leucine-rich repeat-containing protein 46 n=1 Tax=Littorina saxatilis TaxID=31220 RepID=A0AAN9BRH2_9CAEN
MDKLPDDGDIETSPENVPEVRPVRLSLHLIVKRHLPKEAESWSQEQVIEGLNEISHLRLDRENIGQIDSLELLGSKVTNIYLQQNRITWIQNLECLPNLQFLMLAGNRIKTVENLKHLSRLLFLDLSDNAIEDFDIDEFPQSLIILNLHGNPCCDKPDYRGRIVQDLASLKQLDGEEVSRLEKHEVGFHISSEEEGDDDNISDNDESDERLTGVGTGLFAEAAEPTAPFTGYRSRLPDIEVRIQDLSNEMLLRSQNRLEESLQVHRCREIEMDNIRIKNKTPKQEQKAPT